MACQYKLLFDKPFAIISILQFLYFCFIINTVYCHLLHGKPTDFWRNAIMKKLYSIGETAKITGISVQTLRNYSNDSLLIPAYVNEENGYRFFTFDQFHIIDRIKYLRGFGLPLTEIKQIMSKGDVDSIILFLDKQKEQVNKQIEELNTTKEDIQWYIDYFQYLNRSENNALPHFSHFPQRHVLCTPCHQGQTIEDIEVKLAALKTTYTNLGYKYRRQFGYLLDYQSIIDGEWKPQKYFTYITDFPSQKPDTDDHIVTFPEGDYFCLSFYLYHMEELNLNMILEVFKSKAIPAYVIANEHEDNLMTYTYCPYELQFFIKAD